MTHESALIVFAKTLSTFPFYMGKAAFFDDEPIERFKFIIAAQISGAYYSQNFEKPLNPILGETYEAFGQDGAKIFAE